MSKIFSQYKIKDKVIKNRIVMPPMCMYSADEEGNPTSWHYIHYATRAIGGVGLIIMEATAVEKRGRISSKDLGIWDDNHVAGLKKIVDACKPHGTQMGIQLGHAGRKCEVTAENIIAPSSIAFSHAYQTPNEMNLDDIATVIEAYKKAAERALKAGFDFLELHGAHGYLINTFMSPLTNKRTDQYGGNLENRSRFLKEVVRAIRTVWPKEKGMILRVSAEEYAEGGNHPEEVAELINRVKHEGIDIINVSSGGVVQAPINAYPGYQIKFAETIKANTNLPVIGGGLLTSALMAEEMLQNNRVDLFFLGRELLRNPYWALQASNELQADIDWPKPYQRSR
ncbi:NADPH dehydrogenase NamA [Fusibacter ferrireducens]|uniref:NADPH dehydrogenase NamA n=1 Tax=Fusibacter ferrireducens TaxID=2785058 RepID=A0ABR9ZTB4_9FIRM|nr:NADPH dehydrogenase NamA [Fusibacter ferrireducens]MBF4693591.1 NADPH dehydrogenase NamA [Fusibacter ferrireducens]